MWCASQPARPGGPDQGPVEGSPPDERAGSEVVRLVVAHVAVAVGRRSPCRPRDRPTYQVLVRHAGGLLVRLVVPVVARDVILPLLPGPLLHEASSAPFRSVPSVATGRD